MSPQIPNSSYILIPLNGKNLIEGIGIRCKSIDHAEILALALGYRKFKIIQEIEMVSVCRDKHIKKQ